MWDSPFNNPHLHCIFNIFLISNLGKSFSILILFINNSYFEQKKTFSFFREFSACRWEASSRIQWPSVDSQERGHIWYLLCSYDKFQKQHKIWLTSKIFCFLWFLQFLKLRWEISNSGREKKIYFRKHKLFFNFLM